MAPVTYMQHVYWEVLILFCWDMQKYLKDINMKIVNVYYQTRIYKFIYGKGYLYTLNAIARTHNINLSPYKKVPKGYNYETIKII